jgi:hypothetical protein
LYPTTPEEVLGLQLKSTECVAPGEFTAPGELPGGAKRTPFPFSIITVGEFVALLRIVTLPFISCALFGAKVRFNVTVCPGAIVDPLMAQLMLLAPSPVTDTPEIVKFELPLFLRVTASFSALPIAAFPKFRLAGHAEIVRVPVSPVPLTLSVSTWAPELLLRVIVPLPAPIAVGANVSVRFLVPPAASVTGRVKPLVEKPPPRTLTLEMVALPVPGFFNCTDCEILVPTGTFPNATLPGLACSPAADTPVPLRE